MFTQRNHNQKTKNWYKVQHLSLFGEVLWWWKESIFRFWVLSRLLHWKNYSHQSCHAFGVFPIRVMMSLQVSQPHHLSSCHMCHFLHRLYSSWNQNYILVALQFHHLLYNVLWPQWGEMKVWNSSLVQIQYHEEAICAYYPSYVIMMIWKKVFSPGGWMFCFVSGGGL
jgi:hypothetical protein